MKGHRLWDPVAKKKVINRDVRFDEAFMLNENEETTYDGHKQKLVIEVEFDEHTTSSDMGDVDTNPQQQQQQEEPYTVAKGKEKRNQKAQVRYCFEDMFSFALVTGAGDPLSYGDATSRTDRDKWLIAMSEEIRVTTAK